MEYELMVPPKGVIDFDDFTKEYAKEYFEWYMSEIPLRLAQLEKYANEYKKANLKFDKSPESLVPLWKWFESIIETRIMTQEELDKKMESKPEWFQEVIKNNTEFTTLSLAIGADIGIYFAETFIKNNTEVKWGYFTKPKKEMYVNMPVMIGFTYERKYDPTGIIHAGMLQYVKSGTLNKLKDAYEFLKINKIK